MKIYQKIIRFVIIDLDLLSLPFPLTKKLELILKTNYTIVINLLFKKTSFSSIKLLNNYFEYDTPYATKTFLAAIYDFFIVTRGRTIFDSSKPVIVDIGANIGQFLFAVKSFFPDSYIYSIEPDEKVFSLLKKNSKNYERVRTLKYAVNSKEKILSFYVNSEFSEWSSLVKLKGKTYNKINVEARKGDTLLRDVKTIDLLKIDVEGSELDVIKSLKQTLKKTKYVLIEISLDRSKDDPGSTKLLSLLFEENFYIFQIGRIFSGGRGESQGAADILLKNATYKKNN